jgi:hypothetical protein
MSILPPSPFLNTSACPVPEASAGATPCPQPRAPAVIFNEPSSNEGRPKSAPALDAPNTHEHAGATDQIHEIFHFVRKLMKQPPAFVLDEERFMAAIEPAPMFLRGASWDNRRQA